ncbi:hypothetical protein [Microbispora sp. H11081]|nr:hypothetical protein [Microbispora sp. H11081]
MTIDIRSLDMLPAEPNGLAPCGWLITCGITCVYPTCDYTCNGPTNA